MQNLNDSSYTALLIDFSGGSHQAFSKLYDLFYPGLFQHVISKVYNESDAEDILHDLFLSLWKRRESITQISSLPAYLFSSCRYLIINYHRRKKLESHARNIAEYKLDTYDLPLDERLHYRYILDQVTQEIERLPEKCRQIFKMSREDYMSHREIANYLQISESTVENQIGKALQRIKKVSNKAIIYCLPNIFC
ncbi:RNA polymerase sigma factor [Pedobacter sp. AW1-32]|uniref:RNA polymerase sigma factor n=1 Tax=Pedobacter sp. AW1-32 TaxID=3383026 RepID=UPI003FED77F4